MPSPIGHALGGIAAGWLLEPERRASAHQRWRVDSATIAFAGLGIAADLDLLAGAHRGPTHSVGAVLVVGIVAGVALTRAAQRARWAVACAAAYASHIVLDWLGADTSLPFGVPALWPLSPAYYQSPWTVFLAVSRRIHQPPLFWIPNILAVGRELLILLPVVLLAGLRSRKSPRRLDGSGSSTTHGGSVGG